MRIKYVYCFLLVFSSCTLFFVLYWRQFIVTDPEEYSRPQQDGRTRVIGSRKPLEQCNAGSFFSQIDNACVACEKGTFSLKGWIGCLPWLDCKNIKHDIRARRLLSTPSTLNAVKLIYHADWNGYDVVYMKCSHQMFWEDCQNNIQMLQTFQGSELVTQLIGLCIERLQVVTMFYRHGSADQLDKLLSQLNLGLKREFEARLQLATDYLKILDYLHNNPLGTFVMCDSSDLTKTLSQFLVTDTFHLVLNDLDALPKVDHQAGKLVKCGQRELFGWFVAPEQLWPFDDESYDDSKMPHYDEKIDIWRIPDVLTWFLGDTVNALRIKADLKILFSQCKANNPKSRPTASKVLDIFGKTVNELISKLVR